MGTHIHIGALLHRHEKQLVGLMSVAVLAVVLGVMLWYMISSAGFMLFGTIITHVETKEKVVALTFDDGPLPGTTEETLGILKREQVRATFFVIGVEAKRHPEDLRAIIDAGQEVGNHSYSHKYMAFMMPDEVRREVENNDALIRAAGYSGPIPFRVPYNVKFVTLPNYLMTHNRPDISRNVITNEGRKYSPQQIANDIVRQVTPGSIILMHPMYTHTASSRKALPSIIETLRSEGYRFLTVDELLAYR